MLHVLSGVACEACGGTCPLLERVKSVTGHQFQKLLAACWPSLPGRMLYVLSGGGLTWQDNLAPW